MRHYRSIICIFFVLSEQLVFGQHPTLNSNKPQGREASGVHKVLLVPFEPRLYMSEIDRSINAETHLSAKQIRYLFRDGLNEQIYRAIKNVKYNCLDLIEDTLKYAKDLEGVYQYLAYDYLKVPDQTHYKAPVREKESKSVEKGQLVVETNADEKFMDARITNPKTLLALQSKYKTDLFLLVNQLDIRASGHKGPTDLGEGNPNRRIVVHYTLFNSNGVELNSGIVTSDFEPTLNNPKKIVERNFSIIATTLAGRVQRAVQPPQ